MANEYLKRTPTSTGNRSVWTWSGWIKYADPDAVATLFGAFYGDNGRYSIFRRQSGSFQFYGGNYTTDPTSTTVNTNTSDSPLRRDSGNWMHVMYVQDTTKLNGAERTKIYVNGVESSTTDTNTPAINSLGFINSTYTHYISQWTDPSIATQFHEGEMFDVFSVDGQALTPDVFGFYKEGKGYISVGSTQATDFRPGQWVPKAPRTIKTEINRRGGFGVNGYYLPMNDSSNFGADFHTTPNSIIKLKGENLPQPRNGAPTTTDAYVSQLRTDPYAANLVLAVPGIELENTNSELVTNGTFDSNITGWTGYNSTPAWDSVNQRLAIDASTEFDGAETSSGVSVSANTNYTLSLDVSLGTAGGVRIQVRTSDNSASVNLLDVTTSGRHAVNFDSGANTAVYIRLITSGGNTGTAYFDNVSLKEAVAVRDYSADIKGSGTNKTLTANGDAGIALVPSYYGSAMTFDGTGDYFSTTSGASDFDLGTDDFTIEGWVYTTSFANYPTIINVKNTTASSDLYINFRNSSTLALTNNTTVFAGSSGFALNQWNHFALVRSSGSTTMYGNGVAGAPVACTVNFGASFTGTTIGAISAGGDPFSGYIQDLRVYKGVAKYKGGFDVPKPYTPVGIESWRAVPDTTANNFATWNAVDIDGSLVDGNLKASTGTSGSRTVGSTFGISSGKYYTEFYINSLTESTVFIGVVNTSASAENPNLRIYQYNDAVCYSSSNGNQVIDGTSSAYGATFTNGDVIGVSINLDTNEVTFFKNGTSQGTITTKTFTGHYEIMLGSGSSLGAQVVTANFGQNPSFSGTLTAGTFTDSNGKGLFKYQPPSGFLALCEDNLPTPAIADPGEHFKTVLYRGDSNNGHSITGVGFQPDLVWLKERTSTSSHQWHDSVRGAGNVLISNVNNAESYSATYLYSLDSDGFTLGTSGGVNASTDDYVAWCWKAGGSSNTFNVDGTGYATASAAGITDGSIALTGASVNTTAGFSIVTYTSTGSNTATETVGHGLNKTPNMIILKNRSAAVNWRVYHSGINDAGKNSVTLNSTEAAYVFWPSVGSDTFGLANSITTGQAAGTGNQDIVAYCWAEIEGFSKFGIYSTNSSADGPFVYLGFKPAFLLVKPTYVSNWIIMDSSRGPTNTDLGWLYPDLSYFEESGSGRYCDFLSNGFKVRNGGTGMNNGGSVIYAAFAESPFQTANAK